MVNVKSGNRVVSCFVVEPAPTTFDLADLHRGPVASTEVGAALDERLRQAHFWIVNNAPGEDEC